MLERKISFKMLEAVKSWVMRGYEKECPASARRWLGIVMHFVK